MKHGHPPIFVGTSHRRPAQQGVGTVFVSMVLVLAASLVVLYTHRASIMEQRLSGNEIRQKQAFAAAASGIDHALAEMRKAGGIPRVGTPAVPKTLQGNNGTLRYEAKYCAANSIPACPNTKGTIPTCTAPGNATNVAAVSCGWSDDNSSVQRIVQLMGNTPSLAGTISTPVITKGTTNLLTGGASILNYFNDLTVWAGGTFLGQSNTGKTFIRNEVTHPIAQLTDPYRNTGNSPGCNNPPTGYQCSTQGSTVGHDTVLGDNNLASLSPDDFFQYFLGLSPATYLSERITFVVDPGSTLTTMDNGADTYSTSTSSLDGLKGKAIWVEGDASLSGTVGTQDEPVILIVRGNLTLGSNVEINGFVFVTGDINSTGTPTVYGAMVSGGNANATGNLKVIYDPKALKGSAGLGKAAKLPGGWRDW